MQRDIKFFFSYVFDIRFFNGTKIQSFLSEYKDSVVFFYFFEGSTSLVS